MTMSPLEKAKQAALDLFANDSPDQGEEKDWAAIGAEWMRSEKEMNIRHQMRSGYSEEEIEAALELYGCKR